MQPAAAGFAVSPVDGARVTCHFCPHAPLIVPITNSIKPLLQGTGLCLADLGQSRLQDWCLSEFFACFTMVRVPAPARRVGAVLMSLSPCQAQLPGGLVIRGFFFPLGMRSDTRGGWAESPGPPASPGYAGAVLFSLWVS